MNDWSIGDKKLREGDKPQTEDVSTRDRVWSIRTVVTFKADVANRVGMEDQHDRRGGWGPARVAEGEAPEMLTGYNKVGGPDRLA